MRTVAGTISRRRSEGRTHSSGDSERGVAAAALVGGLVALALSWQFLTDASRAVPALDTAWYQWRAEFIQAGDPSELIEIKGARDALAGGYRVAEPVLAAMMRVIGGVAPETPTVILSVLFRVLAAIGLAAFAWRHRRDWLLFYLTLVSVPALFLLQRFFGFLDNFFALALMAGVLLLLEDIRASWVAWGSGTAFLFLGGMTHPTTLALFLLSYGVVILYRAARHRSLARVLRAEFRVVLAGAVAVALTAVFWLGGLWGPTAGLGEAAVPPPQPVSYFLTRSVNVLGNLTPAILFPLMAVGTVSLVRAAVRREAFAEVSLGWTLPLVGMFGFVLGAAYPYFRFFNGTLSPLLLVAVGMAVVVRSARLLPPPRRRIASVGAGLAMALLLGVWWARGLSQWNAGTTWLIPEVRQTLAAADAYLEAEPEGKKALFVIDAQPSAESVPYGEYKEYTNSIHAGLGGDDVTNTFLYFGRVEDLMAGRATSLGDEQYDSISAATAEEALPAVDRFRGNLVVFLPMVFNEYSPNGEFDQRCDGAECGILLAESRLYLLPDAAGTPPSEGAMAAAREAAATAARFVEQPPGPLTNLSGTLLALIRLGLLFVLSGWLIYRRLPERSMTEGLSLIPLLSIAAVTILGMFAVAVVRAPLTADLGWLVWGMALVLGVVITVLPSTRASRTEPGAEGN